MSTSKYPEITLDNLICQCTDKDQMTRAHELATELYGEGLTMADIPKLRHGRLVADTVLGLGLGTDVAIAGLLNHVDSDEAFAQVEAVCGVEVVSLVQGLRTLDIYTKNIQDHSSERTLEAIRRALLGLIEGDVRVVMIRLAMALHTLRAAGSLDKARRDVISRDVQNIFAPLANRLGVWQLKWELEDKAFQYSDPIKYKEIAKALAERLADRNTRVEKAKADLQTALNAFGISAEVTGRPKHIYSIYKKMDRKGIGFDEIMDAHALRVIIDEDAPEKAGLSDEARKRTQYVDCYRILGFVHSKWRPLTEEFDDYIQHPKKNGYRSLHTAVLHDSGKVMEIQIRTRRMHQEAEQGFAAHWAYKEGGRVTPAVVRQVETLRDALDSGQLSNTEDDAPVGDERIFVFTPGWDVIDLPKGATPVDFAYYIHTNVGHRTRGALVNDKMVPLTQKLLSGDKVKIVTFGKKDSEYEIGRPSREWMNPSSGYAFTPKARSRIRSWFRLHERDKNIELGQLHLNRTLREYRVHGQITVEQVAEHFGDSAEDFLVKLGFGDYRNAQVDGAIALISRELEPQVEEITQIDEVFDAPQQMRQKQSKNSKGLTVMGMSGMYTTMAGCCNPVFPERIIGYVTRGRGVTIHRQSCPQLQARQRTEPTRIVEADWGSEHAGLFHVPFRVKSYHSARLLEQIAHTLQGQNINLVKTKSTRQKNHTDVYLLTEVSDIKQADWITQKLSTMPTVFEVQSR
ncbi:MAG: RelA/SpoT family protein [Candidatus Promineifilaceae bacterium]